MPDSTPLPDTLNGAPGQDGIKPGDTPPGEGSHLKENLSWWEQQLQSLPPEARDKLIGKLKGYDKELSRKMSAISRREQEIAEVANQLKEAASKQSTPLAAARTEGELLIDSMMKQTADPVSRETLRNLREIIRQERPIEEIQKEVKELRGLLQSFQQSSQLTHTQQLQRDLPDLEKKYGDDLVDKYRDSILQWGTQYPNFNARQLLHKLADPDEIELALEVQKRRTQPDAKDTKPARPMVTPDQKVHPSDKFKGGGTAQKIAANRRGALTEALAATLKGRVGFGS